MWNSCAHRYASFLGRNERGIRALVSEEPYQARRSRAQLPSVSSLNDLKTIFIVQTGASQGLPLLLIRMDPRACENGVHLERAGRKQVST